MKLKKFTKNKKQKGIVIGSIVGILLLIGGFTLYKTFALYKEEQSFDVLNGVIPSFVYGDVKLAIQVDGNKQTDIPNKKEDYVVEPKCDNGATIEWDYDTWGPIIKNIAKETRCSLNFVSNNKLETLGTILGISNLSIDSLITNIDKLVASKEGMTYLAKSPTLVQQMQASNDKYTENIKKKILDSEVISEDLKYEAGLPCYLIKNENALKKVGDFVIISNFIDNSQIVTEGEKRYTIFKVKNWFQVAWTGNIYLSTINKVTLNPYNNVKFTYEANTDDVTNKLSGTIQLGVGTSNYEKSQIHFSTENKFSGNTRKSGTIDFNLKESNINNASYLIIRLQHGNEINGNTVHLYVDSIALY